MNKAAIEQIERIIAGYLAALEEGQADLSESYEGGDAKDYYAALERHKVLAEAVAAAAAGLNTLFWTANSLKDESEKTKKMPEAAR